MTFVLSATPGPNMVLVMSTSARFGMRAALAVMCGCMTALLSMMTLSAVGLGALLQASPAVFQILRWAGAAYLGYLGIKSWLAPVADKTLRVAGHNDGTSAALYRRAVLVAASNPKAILFAAAFLPQFIQPQLPTWPQFAILLLTFGVIEVGWYTIYAIGGRRLAPYLSRPAVSRFFNRATGAVFVLFAGAMAIAHG